MPIVIEWIILSMGVSDKLRLWFNMSETPMLSIIVIEWIILSMGVSDMLNHNLNLSIFSIAK